MTAKLPWVLISMLCVETNRELKVERFRDPPEQFEADPASAGFDSRDRRMIHASSLGYFTLGEIELLSPAPKKFPELAGHKRSTDALGRFGPYEIKTAASSPSSEVRNVRPSTPSEPPETPL